MEQHKFNGFTYERDIYHCDPSTYFQEVTIASVEPAQNSDNLNIIKFNEVAWQLIAGKDSDCKPGQRVMYFPPESVLPLEFSDALNITKYLDHGKIRSIKLRGNRSEGVWAPIDISKKYLAGIYQWNTPESRSFGKGAQVQRLKRKEWNDNFVKFHDMANIMNTCNMFKPGEKLFYSEKLHGANTRFGLMTRKHRFSIVNYFYKLMFWLTGLEMFSPKKFYVGSHNVVLKITEYNEDTNKWIKAVNKLVEGKNLPVDIEFFGELYGGGVQKGFHYDLKEPGLKIFAAKDDNGYIQIPKLQELCGVLGFPTVNFHELTFESIDQLRALSESPSEYTKNHIREGIVVVNAEDAKKMAKVVSLEYLSQKS